MRNVIVFLHTLSLACLGPFGDRPAHEGQKLADAASLVEGEGGEIRGRGEADSLPRWRHSKNGQGVNLHALGTGPTDCGGCKADRTGVNAQSTPQHRGDLACGQSLPFPCSLVLNKKQ